MKYSLFRLPPAAHMRRMTLETFCEAYDCSLIVEETTGPFRYVARLTGIDVTGGRPLAVVGDNNGPGDIRQGGGDTPEAAIANYFTKLQGRTVISTQTRCQFVMPGIEIGQLEAVEGEKQQPNPAPDEPERFTWRGLRFILKTPRHGVFDDGLLRYYCEDISCSGRATKYPNGQWIASFSGAASAIEWSAEDALDRARDKAIDHHLYLAERFEALRSVW